MELMKVILHSDAIERFEKIYPELVKKDQFESGTEVTRLFKILRCCQSSANTRS